jgi:hypothetical protein
MPFALREMKREIPFFLIVTVTKPWNENQLKQFHDTCSVCSSPFSAVVLILLLFTNLGLFAWGKRVGAST